jgi:hypothetical protein
MSPWQHIVYMSKATVVSANRRSTVEPEIGRILMQPRRNNPARGLVGALYYGDGNFFQALGGEAGAIDQLLDTLGRDARHDDPVMLSRAPIRQMSFDARSLKYVTAARKVKHLLKSFGHERFDPYRFDIARMEQMVTLLQRRPAKVGTRPMLPANVLLQHGGPPIGGTRIAMATLALGAISLLLSLLAIFIAWPR